jgi:predicted phage baseplate assembly protein
VTELKNALPLVDSVTNPEAAAGGADTETTEAVVERAPAALRDRGRAVAPADFERLALAASRRLGRVRCLPRMDEAGGVRLGWVTVVVVPDSAEPRPMPSAELSRQVETDLSAHAPVTLVTPSDRLVVRGPSYVSTSVEATVRAATGERVSAVESRAVAAVDAFLHPLTGLDGEGWPFGSLPCVSDVYAALEAVEGVDHVDDVSVTYGGSGAPVTAGENDDPPAVEADTLVHSGTHTIRVRPLAGAAGTAAGGEGV